MDNESFSIPIVKPPWWPTTLDAIIEVNTVINDVVTSSLAQFETLFSNSQTNKKTVLTRAF
jgi:hypothetical protein